MGRPYFQASLFSAAIILLACSFVGSIAAAQTNPRSTFPGRRVGGGTRGECSARILVHLVPERSVYAPGPSGLVGLVQGPTANPVSLKVSFKQEGGGAESTRTLQAAPAGLFLISASTNSPTVWESSFNCTSGDGGDSSDPMAFVQATSPPALSLLVADSEASDQPVQAALKSLRAQCGSSVPSKDTMAKFGLADLVTDEWPAQLPVHCSS